MRKLNTPSLNRVTAELIRDIHVSEDYLPFVKFI